MTVTALCPGYTETEFAARAAETSARASSSGPMAGDARQVAEAGYRGLMRGKPVVVPGMPTASRTWFMPLSRPAGGCGDHRQGTRRPRNVRRLP